MKKIKLLAICIIVALAACKEEPGHGPITKGGEAPDPVTNISVIPTPGGGRFKYLIPTDPDALYIKAVYESPKGVFKEVRSSIYSDSLNIEGLGTSNEYDIKFYTVSKSEVISQPVLAKLKPLPPPIQVAFTTVNLQPDLGGAFVSYTNPDGKPIVIRIITKDLLGKWQINESLFTSQKSGFFNARGLPAKPTDFGVYITDRWENSSDTLVKTITPLFEEELNKNFWKPNVINAPWSNTMWNDITNFYLGTAVLTKLWDNDLLENPPGYMMSITGGTGNANLSFTIDLGKSYRLSRMKFWMRGVVTIPSNTWATVSPEEWDLVGSADGINWVPLLLNCKAIKPSGLPVGQQSLEDRELAVRGLEYVFPANVPSVRYFRWLNKKTFGNLPYVSIQELSLWSK